MKIESFEDLKAWKDSRELVKRIYTLTKGKDFGKDFALLNQIRRAAISVMSNLSEGFERGSNQEFVQFLYVAKASCGEVRAQLVIAYDQGYIDQKDLDETGNLAKSVSGLIGALINYLKSSKMKGPKFNAAC
ncbi:MAG: four helix bundle protein [Candidatus Zixiibacteriota bacterium]